MRRSQMAGGGPQREKPCYERYERECQRSRMRIEDALARDHASDVGGRGRRGRDKVTRRTPDPQKRMRVEHL